MAFTSIRTLRGSGLKGRAEFPPSGIGLKSHGEKVARVTVGRLLVADAKFAIGMRADFLFDSESGRYAIRFCAEGNIARESGHKTDTKVYSGRAILFNATLDPSHISRFFPKSEQGVVYSAAATDITVEGDLISFVVIPGDPEPEKIRKVRIPPPVVLTGGRPTNAQIKARKARDRAITKAKSLGQVVVDAPPKLPPQPLTLLEALSPTPVAAPPPAEGVIKPLSQPPSV